MWIALKAVFLCGACQGKRGSLSTEEKPDLSTPISPNSPPDEPEVDQILPRQTSSTTTSRLSPVSTRDRSHTNESWSSSTRISGHRRSTRRDTGDSTTSRITQVRSNLRKTLTWGSEEMPGTVSQSPGKGKASFRNAIKAAMIQDADSPFVPVGALERLFCSSTIKATLERCNLSHRIDILEPFIRSKAMRVFAILSWAQLEHHIELFEKYQFHDEHLPVGPTTKGNTADTFSLDEWDDKDVDDFKEHYQWKFLSPVFEQDKFQYEFPDQTPMPFIGKDCISRKETNFSVVEEWRIHRDHIRAPKSIRIPDNQEEHPVVAVKKLKQMSPNDEEFEDRLKAEIDALKIIRKLNHPHLVRALAYYKKGRNHYFLFPWARRGNLRDFWEGHPELNAKFLKSIFTQLCGLAGAIRELHSYNEGGAIRHGDMKPENILCFDDPEKGDTERMHSCILVIADVGLSRNHPDATEFRNGATRTKAGTIKYEPPEIVLRPNEPWTRRYDIWSLGCIYLEFVIWLLYGPKGLGNFRGDLSSLGDDIRFFAIDPTTGTQPRTARLNDSVQKWVDWIKKDARCQKGTAIRSLVDLIVDRMLIVDVTRPQDHQLHRAPTLPRNNLSNGVPSILVKQATVDFGAANDSTRQSRASAQEVDKAMKNIVELATSSKKDQVKWINWNAPAQDGPKRFGDRLVASVAAARQDQQNEYRFTPLHDNWEYAPDNDISRRLLTDPIFRANTAQDVASSQLCSRCEIMPIWLTNHDFSDTLVSLKERSRSCELCRLLVKHVEGYVQNNHEVVHFFRVGSSLTFRDRQAVPILSLYASPSLSTPSLRDHSTGLQFGLPKLHEPGTSAHVKVLAEWIRSCDVGHQCSPKKETFLPTRVLDVGKDSDTIRLLCGTQGQTSPGRYMALSHRWGAPAQHRLFCTFKNNIVRHQRGLDITEFPRTFRDAILVARALNIQYLWVDSLCIVQDDKEDWARESKLMEQVYSRAYVTIAASCASGTNDGFLKARPHRDCLTMRYENGSPYYVCDSIDDFNRDVERGELNRRGWVLQERALSRRTIYFTEKQTYWECGEGVRCETLTKMNNKKASFLGDANFPESIEMYVKGTKIQLFQSLYERYATLDLSFPADRPIAIKGLERRLIRTLKTKGGHGIFDCFFHRCLLWQRSGSSLQSIETFRGEPTPSWSWMAYKGGIRYMDVPFGGVSWAEDIYSPWNGIPQLDDANGQDVQESHAPSEIRARAWELIAICDPGKLILDDPSHTPPTSLKYVIVGTEKSEAPDRRVYVLVVTSTVQESDVYKRVGVGILDESLIWRSKPPVSIRLV